MALHPALMKLPEAKQTELRKVHADAMKSVESLIGEIRAKRQALGEALRRYPLETADVSKQQAVLEKLQEQMFRVHLDALAASQKLMDKEIWEAVMQGPPMGHGRPIPPGAGRPMPGPGRPGAPGQQGFPPPPGAPAPPPAAREPAK